MCVFQAKFDGMKKQMESMEMEVMEARLIRASELNGEMDDDDTGEFVLLLSGQNVPRMLYILLSIACSILTSCSTFVKMWFYNKAH